MNKNTLIFIAMSALVIFVWSFFINPQQQANQVAPAAQTQVEQTKETNIPQTSNQNQNYSGIEQTTSRVSEEQINIVTDLYKLTLTNKGAAVLSWEMKEKNGDWINLVMSKDTPMLANFPNVNYKVVSNSNDKIVFEYISPEGWKITKAYTLSKDSYMHALNIKLEKVRQNANLPQIDLSWGPGLGTDQLGMKDNLQQMRVIAHPASKPEKLKKFKNTMSEPASAYTWSALDNRYFLVAFIPKDISDFKEITSSRADKKSYYSISLSANPKDSITKEYDLNLYVGPKGYEFLKSYDIGLEKSVDFGFFGFLGKIVFAVLSFIYAQTHNYGWSIIILTIMMQIIIMPLTLKSFKSMAGMKRVQPLVKEIQAKYKGNQQRLNAEMMNVYKAHKVNPLGGCLPMLLQLPIFWAFFTMLRNAYTLRGEGWILWVNDLSMADTFIQISGFNIHLLPLIMGAGMFFQQKMTAVTSDPTQRKMMYIMPIVFTFMFWSFPAGLVLYWLTNSIVSMIEQFFILRRDSVKVTTVG